jgi:hypothetical protein
MTHPIPAPRPSSDPMFRRLPRRRPLEGPYCPRCEHPSCRRLRAARQPRLGGQHAEYSREHARATALQTRHRHLVIWFGEQTLSYWVASSTGLAEVPDAEALERLLSRVPVHA